MKYKKIRIALTTFSSKENATNVVSQLLNKKLISCAQIEGPIQSSFFWENNYNQISEWRVVLKFSEAKENELFEEIHAIHEYKTPQWVAWSVDSSSTYAEWVEFGS